MSELQESILESEEEWRDIKGYEGRYEVSTLGNIRSLLSKKILKVCTASKGRPRVTLYRFENGIRMKDVFQVHQLVAQAFLGDVPEGLQVDHINGIKIDNRSENLEYVTGSINVKRAIKLGLIKPVSPGYGNKHHSYIPIERRNHIRELYKSGNYSQRGLAKIFKHSMVTIFTIIHEKEGEQNA